MDNRPLEELDADTPITINDCLKVIKKKKLKIALCTLTLVALFGCYSLLSPIQYKSEATFKEKSNSTGGAGVSSLATAFLSGIHPGEKSEAKTIMRSRKLLEEVAKTLNLQAQLTNNKSKPSFFDAVKENIVVEYYSLLGRKHHPLPDIRENLTINEIEFHGEIPETLTLIFNSEESFHLYDSHDNVIGYGRINTPFSAPNFTFTLSKLREMPIKGETYSLTLIPLSDVARGLKKQIEIDPDKDDSSLLKLSYKHRNRFLASNTLNQLMASYQTHLRSEQQRVSSEQIAYLNRRENEMMQTLKQVVDEVARQYSSEASAIGFIDSEKAMDFLSLEAQNFRKKVLKLDLELKRQEHIRENNGGESFFHSDTNPHIINEIIKEIQLCKLQYDGIKLALQNQENLEHQKTLNNQFKGINLEASEQLYIHYSQELSAIESKILQTQFILNELVKPDFEISSLSAMADDPVVQTMVQNSSEFSLALHDETTRSVKEKDRFKKNLDTQKRFFQLHLGQSVELLKLNEGLVKDKINALLYAQLELLQQKITILQKQLSDATAIYVQNMEQEKVLLQHHQKELRLEMASLPQKWASENLVEHQLKVNAAMVEELIKLVESKNISNNLEMIQSAPVDKAIPSVKPENPRILMFALMGGLLGTFLSAGFVIARAAVLGFPITQDHPKAKSLL